MTSLVLFLCLCFLLRTHLLTAWLGDSAKTGPFTPQAHLRIDLPLLQTSDCWPPPIKSSRTPNPRRAMLESGGSQGGDFLKGGLRIRHFSRSFKEEPSSRSPKLLQTCLARRPPISGSPPPPARILPTRVAGTNSPEGAKNITRVLKLMLLLSSSTCQTHPIV